MKIAGKAEIPKRPHNASKEVGEIRTAIWNSISLLTYAQSTTERNCTSIQQSKIKPYKSKCLYFTYCSGKKYNTGTESKMEQYTSSDSARYMKKRIRIKKSPQADP